jgi:hypothetical protein
MAAFHWSSDDGWLVALMPVSLPAGSRQRRLPDRHSRQQDGPNHAHSADSYEPVDVTYSRAPRSGKPLRLRPSRSV